MKRRSLFYRAACALLGLSASAKQADAAVDAALQLPKSKLLKWTVWFKNDTMMEVMAQAATPMPVTVFYFDQLSGERVEEQVTVVMFTDEHGDVVGQAPMRDIKAYGCAYPSEKVECGYIQKSITFCAPPKP